MRWFTLPHSGTLYASETPIPGAAEADEPAEQGKKSEPDLQPKPDKPNLALIQGLKED